MSCHCAVEGRECRFMAEVNESGRVRAVPHKVKDLVLDVKLKDLKTPVTNRATVS